MSKQEFQEDAFHRLESLTPSNGSSLTATGYAYDAASRLHTVTYGADAVTYGYVSNANLVETVASAHSGTTRMTTTKTYDHLNRLASIQTPLVEEAVTYGASYTYNSVNQRVDNTEPSGEKWQYTYDPLGQVTGATKHLTGGATKLGFDFAYDYDAVGNRKSAVSNRLVTTYNTNNLNQYTTAVAPTHLYVRGTADSTAHITVEGQPTVRQGDNYDTNVLFSDPAAGMKTVKAVAVKNGYGPDGEDLVAEDTRTTYVPSGITTFSHDEDGNLADDGRWTYEWDAENRLFKMEANADAVTAGVTKQKLEFAYDAMGRRVSKKVFSWNGSAWVLAKQTFFLYDNWNMVAELNALSSNAVVRTYAWGLDLSGTLQGAGGVGGLVMANDGTDTHFVAYDGNGNVLSYVNAGTGATSASFEYNGFGEILVSAGTNENDLLVRFSSKCADAETGLVYYGFRYYSDQTGRWLSRDPIKESGGSNLYGMLGDDLMNRWDFVGLGFPGDPMDPNTALAEAALFDSDQIAAQQLIREVAAREAMKQAAARGAATIAAAAVAGSIGGDSKSNCLTCLNSSAPLQEQPNIIVGPHAPSRQYTFEEESQQLQERKMYHRVCDEPPPANLKGCDLLRWLLNRAKNCIQLRQGYMEKWNDTYPGHQNQIDLRMKEIKKLEERIAKECGPCPKK